MDSALTSSELKGKASLVASGAENFNEDFTSEVRHDSTPAHAYGLKNGHSSAHNGGGITGSRRRQLLSIDSNHGQKKRMYNGES
jgi:hypothetical protein